MPLLRAEDLRKEFTGRGGSTVYAVDGVSFTIEPGEVLGLIGESGSGKSTTGRLVIRLLEPTGGTIEFDGEDLTSLSKRELRRRRQHFQVVFQEPFESLNPRMSIGAIVEEPLIVSGRDMTKQERRRRVIDTLEEVALGEAFYDRRPAQLSGGQQQRVGMARALVTEPRLIVLDEPTSSLDLTVRAGILNMLARLREAHGLSYLFISHDIQTVRYFCTRTAVMYLGRIVEIGPTQQVLEHPRHPYTKALLSAALSVTPGARLTHTPLEGDPPKPTSRPRGCSLAGRCPVELPACATTPVALDPVAPDHEVACLRASEAAGDRPPELSREASEAKP
jgi:peptide/nickel transport system ATP-binding protein/oligopeptide transport system ATP-binding protein